MQRFLIAMLLAAGCSFQTAQAEILEDLLGLPAIQGLLGRLPELPIITRNCADPTFKQRNATFCPQAEQRRKILQEQNRESPG